MSQENVEIVKRAIDGFNRRDLDAAAREFHPDAEVDWSRSNGVEAGVYRGRERTQRFWGTFLEMFESVVAEPYEWIDHGDWVIVLDKTRMRGRDGIEVQARNVTVVALRDKRIIRWQLCRDRAEALKAVGLEE
jgi:ketosteroid isomerase-like protein